VRHSLSRTLGCSVVAAIALSMASDVMADPAADAMAKLNELSTQALQTRESVTAAQRDADAKLAAQIEAEDRHRADLAALDAANAELAPYQAAVNRLASMTYMNGGTSQFTAVLTATSPQQLIDRLSLQQVVAGVTADQMKAFGAGRDRAAAAAKASEASAAEARTAAEQSAAVSADLQKKWSDLRQQIIAAEAQYASLTPQQQAVVDAAAALPPPPPPDAAPPPTPADLAAAVAIPDLPEALPVGKANEAGLQPNTILAARAVSMQFPQVGAIDGVRPDSKPWHPNGLAIDIMIPNPESPEGIALGDAIRDFAMSNSGRFGLQDVIWRGVYYTPAGPQSTGYGHFDHVHITTLPSR
jgi:peptidoglycan DL-endopeptidase CwlO